MLQEKIKNERVRRGLSQAEMAEKVGVSQAMYSYYENGWRKPSLEVAKRIADALEISLDELVDG